MDKHKKKHHVNLVLNNNEFARLVSLSVQAGLSKQYLMELSIECGLALAERHALVFPSLPVLKFREGRMALVRVMGEMQERLKLQAESQRLSGAHLARLYVLLGLESCEKHGLKGPLDKEEFTRLLLGDSAQKQQTQTNRRFALLRLAGSLLAWIRGKR